MTHNKRSMDKQDKIDAIIEEVWYGEFWGKPNTPYAVAIRMGYTPNGCFYSDVWLAVDMGYLNAKWVTPSGSLRSAWTLELTEAAVIRHFSINRS